MPSGSQNKSQNLTQLNNEKVLLISSQRNIFMDMTQRPEFSRNNYWLLFMAHLEVWPGRGLAQNDEVRSKAASCNTKLGFRFSKL